MPHNAALLELTCDRRAGLQRCQRPPLRIARLVGVTPAALTARSDRVRSQLTAGAARGNGTRPIHACSAL